MATVNEFYSDIAFHPGETLAEKLEELNMGPKEFAVRTGKPEKTIIAILKGESSLTAEMAVLFENVLKIPARYWIKKQHNFDEYKAREKRNSTIESAIDWACQFPINDMVKSGWLPNVKSKEEKVVELFNYFGVSNPQAWEDFYFNQQLKVAFRISLSNTKEPFAISARLSQGEIQADKIEVKPYSEQKFKRSLGEIKLLMKNQPSDFFIQLQCLCSEAGVKVVYTPCIRKAPLSGATRWINDNPVIQLSGRYNQNDIFWFTFFHEAGHVVLHGKKEIFLEDIEYSESDRIKEEQANQFAVKWTFSLDEEKEVLKSLPLSEAKIIAFAEKFGTHPAIILGRLHREKRIPYAIGRQFFIKLNLSN